MNNIELNKNESEFYQLYTWISEDNTIRLISDGLVGKISFSPGGWTNEYLTGYTMKNLKICIERK